MSDSQFSGMLFAALAVAGAVYFVVSVIRKNNEIARPCDKCGGKKEYAYHLEENVGRGILGSSDVYRCTGCGKQFNY